MHTKKVLEMLPDDIRLTIENLKQQYNRFWREENYKEVKMIRSVALGYTLGLRDGGLVTDRQRMTLYIYVTL